MVSSQRQGAGGRAQCGQRARDSPRSGAKWAFRFGVDVPVHLGPRSGGKLRRFVGTLNGEGTPQSHFLQNLWSLPGPCSAASLLSLRLSLKSGDVSRPVLESQQT